VQIPLPSNHDQWRIVTRRGEPAARAAAVLLLTLPGMVFIYNGEEIGMENGEIPPEFIHDPSADESGFGGRDPERTPLQWSPGKNAGFSEAKTTWLPVAANYKTHNVETEGKDPGSFLSLYRGLGELRNKSDALRYGSFKIVDVGQADVLAYERHKGSEKLLTLINFSKEAITFKPKVTLGKLVLSSDAETKLHAQSRNITLQPHEAAVFTGGSKRRLPRLRLFKRR
jgi:alpha-glucosidase